MGTTTKFWVRGDFVKNGSVQHRDIFDFSFPPNDPKYLAEFVRALNYPHLKLLIVVSYIPGIDRPFAIIPTNVIDWMELYSDWELDYTALYRAPWNQVKIDPKFNQVRLGK